jgi:hypothetical protein
MESRDTVIDHGCASSGKRPDSYPLHGMRLCLLRSGAERCDDCEGDCEGRNTIHNVQVVRPLVILTTYRTSSLYGGLKILGGARISLAAIANLNPTGEEPGIH